MSWEKWKKYQFTSLRDQIWGHAVLIKEANAIAMELNKQVEFQFTLLREGVYSPMPSDIPTVQMGQSTLVVEVRDERHGAIHYWSLNKLRSRLDAMRKLYEGNFSNILNNSLISRNFCPSKEIKFRIVALLKNLTKRHLSLQLL